MNAQLTSIGRMRDEGLALLIQYGPKVVAALVILVAGFYAGRWTKGWLARRLDRMELEPPVRELLARAAGLTVFGLFAVIALENLGVELLPLIAGLSVAGAGLALAAQGVLGNLVAGLSILLTRPFRVGEYISVANEEGQVDRITLFSSILAHPDRSRVVIPNRKIAGEILHNFGTVRQLDLAVNVAYDTDLGAALALIGEVLARNAKVLKEPPALVRAVRLGDWAIRIAVNPWVQVADYVSATGEINREVLETFRGRGIVVPLPQSEVRLVGPAHGP